MVHDLNGAGIYMRLNISAITLIAPAYLSRQLQGRYVGLYKERMTLPILVSISFTAIGAYHSTIQGKMKKPSKVMTIFAILARTFMKCIDAY